MTRLLVILVAVCILLTVVTVSFYRKKTKETFQRISLMLEEATENSFTEKSFDESQLSALETKFAHYLSASESSARRVAEERDRIKTLISDISHQTKTPIANLLLYSELLSEMELPEEAKGNVKAMYQQTETLHFLIDSLIKLSRLENGIITMRPQEHSVLPLLTEIYNRFSVDARRKGLRLTLEETDAKAVFDFKWTKEAIGNIVDNAVKYTAVGNVTISVQSYDIFTRINICDTGMGVSEEESAKIFARFYRGEKVKDYEGVGIGLYLAREVISSQGGYIKVEANKGQGTKFSVFLPKEAH